MSGERRTRQWWRKAVARYQKSGLTAEVFAGTEGLNVRTLRWWVSELRRAERGGGTSGRLGASNEVTAAPEAVVPVRVNVPTIVEPEEVAAPSVEVVVGDELVVRFGDGADAGFVAELIGRLRAAAC